MHHVPNAHAGQRKPRTRRWCWSMLARRAHTWLESEHHHSPSDISPSTSEGRILSRSVEHLVEGKQPCNRMRAPGPPTRWSQHLDQAAARAACRPGAAGERPWSRRAGSLLGPCNSAAKHGEADTRCHRRPSEVKHLQRRTNSKTSPSPAGSYVKGLARIYPRKQQVSTQKKQISVNH